jgi:sarcosine oxidase, subunit alpha
MKRLSLLPTFRIQSGKELSINFGQKRCRGFEGDTIASVLYANDVRIFGRSLKYHRPRGLYSLDGECSNTMMAVDGIPNVRAENTPAVDGMNVKAQNVFGKTPDFDMMRFMDELSWAMPAGFYYQTLHKPARIWPLAIKHIRKAAGLGVLSPDFQMMGNFDEIYISTDVCVIGGGPAGMCAALSAANQGLRVVILENRPWFGGYFEYRPKEYQKGMPLYQKARNLAESIEQTPNIRAFKNTAMIGSYNNNLITAFQRGSKSDCFTERYMEIRAKSVVVATGCIERPLLFENNERPGVMQIGCAHRLARTWGLLPGKRAVFSVGHDLGLEAAIDLSDLGLDIACVADIRQDSYDSSLAAELEKRNIPFLPGWVALRAHGAKTLNAVTLSSINATRQRKLPCDMVVASAGMTPVTSPVTLAGGKLQYDNHTGFFLPATIPSRMHVAGRLLGLDDPFAIEASGRLAGLKSAADCGKSVENSLKEIIDNQASLPGPVRGTKLVTGPVNGKETFICFDEDCTLKNINQAMHKGFDVPELIKRFTSAGTGPGQGGIPGHNLPMYVAETGESPDRNPKPTTARPPLVPTYLSTYAGSNHDMSKRTPVHDSQVQAGGKMERIGVWNRARRFSSEISARKEIENVRNNVGLLDASTLGKFRIFGPDALKALQRVYVGDMSKVAKGKVKYSAMCNEDGCLLDDGIVTKIRENDYYMTASTGRAGQTIEWIRFHTRYDKWNFHMVNLTDAYGVINLAGPNARRVLEKMTKADVSNEAFPFSGYREFSIQNVPIRAMRLGFVGELSYELHVPSSYMQSLWEFLEKAGKEFGIQNFGLEAQNTLRMEKGHIIIGSESEQRTTIHDLGLGFLWYRNKPEADTVGAFALKDTEHRKGRLKLVGFKMKEPNKRVPKDGSPIVDSRIRGYVCTARYSWTLQEPIGMALVDDDLCAEGTMLKIYEDGCKGNLLSAKVVSMPFYDPDGKRMRY